MPSSLFSGDIMSDASQCNLAGKTNHTGGAIAIKNPYGGIPQNLVTNLIGFSILLVVSARISHRCT